jgi:hypothetical protein
MRIIARLVLRYRTRQSVLNALRFAERLRRRNSEFAPSYKDTLNGIGDELAALARTRCRNEADRRALLAGLMSAFERMYRGKPELAQRIAQRMAPRVMMETAEPPASAWARMAV